jgi:hypothetical protein
MKSLLSKSKTVNHYKYKIGIFILISNFAFIIYLLFLNTFGAFDDAKNEFVQLIRVLIPIQSVYFVALLKYVVANKDKDDETKEIKIKQSYKLFIIVSNTVIFSHLLILFLFISYYALWNYNFETFINYISIFETAFGVYVGTIITELFSVKEKKEDDKLEDEATKS